MRFLGFAIALVMAAACGRERAATTPSTNEEPTTTEAEQVKELVRLIEHLASCPLEEWTWDEESCPAAETVKEAFAYELAEPPRRAALRENVGHPSATIRLWVVDRLLRVEPELAAVAMAAEQDLVALEKMIEAAGRVAYTPASTQAVLAATAHASADIRRAAVVALTQGWPEGGLDRMLDRVENDPDDAVRAAACNGMGWASDDDQQVPAVYDRVMIAATPPTVYAACLKGLVARWQNLDNQPAYERTLSLLATGRHDVEPTEAFSSLDDVVEDRARADELIAALATWVGDLLAPVDSRRAALVVMARLRASKTQLQVLVRRGDDEQLQQWIKSLMRGVSIDSLLYESGVRPGGI